MSRPRPPVRPTYRNDFSDCLTTALVPLKAFPVPPSTEPTIEVAEFEASSERDVHPYTTFVNHLYVYPLNLNFDTQKMFARARNIACLVELRDSDNEEARGLQCIYGRPGQSLLVSQASCAVLHHNTIPTWYEEVKIKLPINLLSTHHLLFIFYHISCDTTKKRENGIENCVGYAWLPLLQKGKLNVDVQTVPVAAHLPPGYLAVHPFGLGKGVSHPPNSIVSYLCIGAECRSRDHLDRRTETNLHRRLQPLLHRQHQRPTPL